ncbi:hypothetical protein JG688_00017907 [Phytophthora aleatoria]|uniref:Uncharacterized protein n=1 Tax=Phytophthora aleatoria TaxID=2496075 RepID=A0A8J5ID01_9STRA|nr:hypothetical protein JG688_00017907 [Phytophthora aleatoria]
MLSTLTNGQEIAAPLAGLYIHRSSPFWFSHEHVYVNLEKFMQSYSCTEDISVLTHINNDESTPIPPTKNKLKLYWKRQSELEQVNFITISEQYRVKASKSKYETQRNELILFEKNTFRKQFVVSGKQLPDFNTNLSAADNFFYYTALLTLFKPHRSGELICEAFDLERE